MAAVLFLRQRNYGLVSSKSSRFYSSNPLIQQKKRRMTLLGFGANISLTVTKLFLGYQTGSSAMVADAVHSASDAVSDVIALASIHIAGRSPDAAQPFGYGHFETLGSLALGVSLAGAGLGSGYLAVDTLLHLELAQPFGLSPELLFYTSATLVGSVLVKEALFRMTYRLGKETKSSLLLANAWHHRTDSLSSVVAGVGICGSLYGYPMLDPVAALLVSGMVIGAGAEVAWDAIGDLTDRQTTDHFATIEKVRLIAARLASCSEIVSTHDIRLRRMGGVRLVDLHLIVDNSLSVTASYQAGQRLRRAILNELPEDVTDVFVHLDAGEDAFSQVELDHVPKKNHYEIEVEVRKVAKRLCAATAKVQFTVSHVNVHYVPDDKKMKMIAEVNLSVINKHKDMTLAELDAQGNLLRDALLKAVDGLDIVDLHVELDGPYEKNVHKKVAELEKSRET